VETGNGAHLQVVTKRGGRPGGWASRGQGPGETKFGGDVTNGGWVCQAECKLGWNSGDTILNSSSRYLVPTIMLRQRAPKGIEVHSLHWSSYFHVHHRQVAQLRAGRIFVAGDAAHIHSPFGGQGMNTGLQDAWNLAWKLDLAVRGRARQKLLESYTAERRPVIRNVISTTDLITKVMGIRGRVAQGIRDLAIPVVSRLALFQGSFVQRLSQLGVTYRGSPIVRGSGKRYFDESLRGGRGIGSRFVLFIGADTDSPTVLEAKRLAEDLHDILEVRAGQREDIVLIRPDGYTAYESRKNPTPSTLKSIRELVEGQAVSQGSVSTSTLVL
jgi:hypothetical protein